jgi:glucuronate isomerase
MTDAALQLHPDRLLPAEATTRGIARRLYAAVRDLPIISPHGHVPPEWIAEDVAFGDPTSLLISPDHYVTRLLHAHGVPLESLGAGRAALTPDGARAAWRALCTHWDAFRGTPSRFWLESELAEIFAVTVRPSAATADAIYDQIADILRRPDFRPRALLERFDIEVLATTDAPADDLAHHAAIRDDEAIHTRVLPTFRPDRYLEPGRSDWPALVDALGAAADTDTSGYKGFTAALEDRRRHFIAHGAVSADHGVREPYTVDLSDDDAAALYRRAVAGDLDDAGAREFAGNMLLRMAGMSARDGLVMTVHPGVHRNHSTATFERLGPDTGHDIPITTTYTANLRPLLERHGLERGLHLVLFSVDETVYSREIAPLAGFYPSVFIGAPWWFLDAPDAVLRFRAGVTETAGFYRGSGFIDDTRAFLSIPARHDMARRLDAAFLARLVREGRVSPRSAERIIVDLVDVLPRTVFKL